MSSILPYHVPPQTAPSSEFDFHFEREMTRRLRKRVLWYCGITIAISVLASLPGIFTGGPPIQIGTGPAPPPVTRTLHYVSAGLSLALYVTAFFLFWYRPFRRETMIRLTIWLYVLASIPSLIGTRLILQISVTSDMSEHVITERRRDQERRKVIDAAGLAPPKAELQANDANPPATSPTTRRAADEAQIRTILNAIFRPALFFCVAVPGIFLINHTFVCLFIPWTFRQSLAPAIILLVIVLAIFATDLLGGAVHWLAPLIALPLSAMMLVPGSAFCWWRYRGMRRDIRLTFDSERLRSIQAELNGAKRILESALPAMRNTGPVRVNYVYEPMRQIGGDLLFVHPPADSDAKSVSAVLLDVTGHGIAAALSVNRLIGELERLFAESPGAMPGDVLNTLNNYVHFTMARHDMYVTAVAMHVDPARRRLTYASAGHPTAYIHRADGSVVAMESTTMLLGISDNQLFSPDAVDVPLNPGDCVVAYTDGASEAVSDATHEMLGMLGVRNTITAVAQTACPASQWPTEIMRRVAAFRNAPPLDDTLLVVIQSV